MDALSAEVKSILAALVINTYLRYTVRYNMHQRTATLQWYDVDTAGPLSQRITPA